MREIHTESARDALITEGFIRNGMLNGTIREHAVVGGEGIVVSRVVTSASPGSYGV